MVPAGQERNQDTGPTDVGTVRPDKHVVYRRLGDKLVLVHLVTNSIFELNATSARFWELLVEDGEIASIEARMAAEFDVDQATLHDEVAATLAKLAGAKLVSVDEPR
jgi:hypothetical protein